MMFGKLVVLAAALSAVAYAAPAMNPDTAVPEEEALVQSYAEAKQTVAPDVSDGQFLQEYSAAKEEYSAAKEAVFLLQKSGKTDDACRQLATSEKDVVTKDAGTQQKLLDDLPSGKSCSDEGKDLVTKYEKSLKDLNSKLTTANDEAKKAKEATVDFGPQNLDSMTGTCAIPKSNSKYQAAQKKASTAGGNVETLNGQVDAAKLVLKEAKDEHTKAVHKCNCKVQKSHNDGWTTADRNTERNKKEWAKAENMLCVLNGDTTCKPSTAPTVTKPTISDGAKNAKCAATQMKEEEHAKKSKIQTIADSRCKDEQVDIDACIGTVKSTGHVQAFVKAGKASTCHCSWKKCGKSSWNNWSGGKGTVAKGSDKCRCPSWGRGNHNYIWKIIVDGKHTYMSSEANALAVGENVHNCRH